VRCFRADVATSARDVNRYLWVKEGALTRVVNVFGKRGCAKCESTKRKIDHLVNKRGLEAEVLFTDLDTPEGMAEAAFLDIGQVPTTIVRVDGNDQARWDGQIPRSEDVLGALMGDGLGGAPN